MSQVTAFLLVVIAALGGFYGGFRYEKGAGTANAASSTNNIPKVSATTPAGAGGGGTAFGGGSFGGGGAGGGFRGSAGTISNLTDKGFTLSLANGSTVNVSYGSTSPTVRKTTDGSLADLQNGETVSVTGSRDANNNLTAQQITIVPTATPGG